jgi:hypothetical protein
MHHYDAEAGVLIPVSQKNHCILALEPDRQRKLDKLKYPNFPSSKPHGYYGQNN